MKDYDFAFSIDADMIITGDILSLIPRMPPDKKIGAVRCAFRNAVLPAGITSPLHHETRLVGINDTRNYFNAGMMLFNIKAIEYEDRAYCVRLILREWPGHAESILNHVFHDSTHFFSSRWNFPMTFISDTVMDFHPEIRDDMAAGRQHPRVLHFLYVSKPWHPAHEMTLDLISCPAYLKHLQNYKNALQAVMQDAAQLAPHIICGPAWDDMEHLVAPQEPPLH